MPGTTVTCPRCATANGENVSTCSSCGFDLRSAAERTTLHELPESDPLLERLRRATLGDYDVAIELGRGGMAAVYLAHDLALDRKVAIKVMLPQATHGAEMTERFRREARTAANLSHPHIIPIYQVREVDGLAYFVMKFVEGRSLDSIVQEKGQLPVRMVETILAQSASALAYAHRKGVIHRDIKPANLMLDEDGWAVVTDFGIAKVTAASMLTTTGATMGTPYYMSPEQCSSKPVTGQSDQYSLGIAAYELLTGRPPFDGQSLMEVMSGHFFTPPASIRIKRPDCPTPLEEIILKMIAKEPSDRFASLDDVVTALAMPALGHDDPVRSQMIELAKSGSALRARLSVPVSPIPKPRAPGAPAARPSANPKAAPSPKWARTPIVLGALAVTLLLGGGYVALNWQRLSAMFGGTVVAPPDSGVPETNPTEATPGGEPSAVVGDTAAQDAGLTAERIDSIARAKADSMERARLARARADSITRARIAKERSDSVARAVARADSIERAGRPADDSFTRFVIGTRVAGAMLYINGDPVDTLSRPRARRIRAGTHRLSIVLEGCTPWDSTVTIAPNDTLVVGLRQPRCP